MPISSDFSIVRNHEGYLVTHKGQEVNVIPLPPPLNKRNILESFVRYLPENQNYSDLLEYNKHVYQWQRVPDTGLFHRIGCYFSSFFITPEKKVFELVEIGEERLENMVCPHFNHIEVESESQADPSISLSDSEESERFSDPYTKLAALAFQQFEPAFSYDKFSDCKTSLVEADGALKLQAGQDPAANARTVQNYHAHLVRMYGKEKIDYIQHLYGIDFSRMIEKGEPLTPEHIYRMNIGATNLEIQDVKQFYSHLLEKRCNLNELHCLRRTVEDFPRWMEEHFKGSPPFDALSSSQVELLAQSLAVQGEERERAFTGRAIQSCDLDTYNAWLDQQQLGQSFSEYENTDNWEAFYETLAFVIATKHLVREHPTEKFRIGALIPTPRDKNGLQHWYKVTSCVSNGLGIFSYTLEALGKDSSLPPIKLYRGTTTSPFCLHGKVSLINDFNPFNTPGYLGKGLGDPYEAAFFKDRSIPLWVGYALEGEKKIGEEAEAALQAANRALIEEKIKQHAPKTMPEILRKHDAVLVDLLLTTSGASHLLPVYFSNRKGVESYPDLISDLVSRYIQSKGPVEEKRAEEDAAKLKDLLLLFIKNNPDENKKNALMDVVDDLNDQIINRKQVLAEQEQTAGLTRQVYSHLLDYENRMKRAENPQEKKSIAKDWAEALIREAKDQKEHPSQKKNADLLFLGHSLGASCAQIHAHHFFSAKDRIPLPGHHLSVYGYDDPGINKDDNQAFIDFGNAHADLLERLGITVYANHSQEAGDPVGLSGEAHLGGSVKKEELAKLTRWMKFKGDVFERMEHPKTPSIANATMAHINRFRLCTEGVDYKKTPYDAEMQGIMDEGTSKEAAELKSQVWKIGFATWYFNEQFRRDIKRMILLAMMADREKERDTGFTDPHGVFAVDETGILSAPK